MRWLEASGKALLLAGLFLMVSGDGLTNRHMPVPALAWPWLYLVVLTIAFALLTAAGCIRRRGAPYIGVLGRPLALLTAAFLLSAIFSHVPSLTAIALACVAGIVAFGWLAARALDHPPWHDAIWTTLALAVLWLSYQVLSWRMEEGLQVAAYQVLNNAWMGKLQLAWLFNLLAPFFLARCISDPRPAVSAFSGLAWLASGATTYVLFSRIGSLTFLLTALGVCALSSGHWRRWVPVLLAGAFAGGAIFVGSTETTRLTVTTFMDAERNPGIPFRLSVWHDAIRMFKAHPVTGVGLGTFDDVAFSLADATVDPHFYRQGWHAHNVYLHLLAETGLVGFAAYAYLWLVILTSLARAWWRAGASLRPHAAAALCSVLAFLMLSFTEVLIGARVHASLRMNLVLVFSVVYGMHLSRLSSGPEACTTGWTSCFRPPGPPNSEQEP
jgi:O-antigen ligase